MNEVDAILICAEARMRRRYHQELGLQVKQRKVFRRGHKKRHSENREKAIKAKLKAKNQKHKLMLAKNARTKYMKAVRAYWKGEGDHP